MSDLLNEESSSEDAPAREAQQALEQAAQQQTAEEETQPEISETGTSELGTSELAVPPSSGMAALWREWVFPALVIALVMFSFRSAVADWNDVPTGSMKPTILEGDRIFINKVAYDLRFPFTMYRLAKWDHPKWGDVVVLHSPKDGKRLVKRVVGLPGDMIQVRGPQLWVNGDPAQYAPLDPSVIEQIDLEVRASYLFAEEVVAEKRSHPIMLHRRRMKAPFGPYEVPEGHYFVMGDNRHESNDSRDFGPVERDLILGQATAVALSLDYERYYRPRFERFFTPLP